MCDFSRENGGGQRGGKGAVSRERSKRPAESRAQLYISHAEAVRYNADRRQRDKQSEQPQNALRKRNCADERTCKNKHHWGAVGYLAPLYVLPGYPEKVNAQQCEYRQLCSHGDL